VDEVPVERIKEFQTTLAEFLTTRKTDLLAKILKEKKLSDELIAALKAAADEFKPTWAAKQPPAEAAGAATAKPAATPGPDKAKGANPAK
jgi:hypothetical protein